MQKDSSTGMNVPMLTPEQEKAAYDSVKNAILLQVNSTLKQQENTYRAPVKSGGGGSGANPPTNSKSVQHTIDAKGNLIVPMSGVNVKTGTGTENISDWGKIADNGKLFISYSYPVTTKNEDGDPVRTTKSVQVYEGSNEFNRRLGQLINPSTGKKVRSLNEAKQYVNSLGGGNKPTKSNTSKPKQVVQNGITYTYNEKTKQYE
jgi:hypothetical protein